MVPLVPLFAASGCYHVINAVDLHSAYNVTFILIKCSSVSCCSYCHVGIEAFFFCVPGTAIDTAETVATNLYNVGNTNSLWDFRRIATRMREVIVQVQTATTTELGRMVTEVSGKCLAVHLCSIFFCCLLVNGTPYGAIRSLCGSL